MPRDSVTSRSRFWPPILAVLAATAASPFLHGYALGYQNHEIQLPYLLWLQDPTLFPGDPMIEAMGSYFSFFWTAAAWISARLPLATVFLVGHLLTTLLRFAGVWYLGRVLFPGDRRAAYIGLWLVFWGRTGVGFEALNWIYFAHTPVAAAIGVWTIALALGGKTRRAMLLAGLIFNLHAMQSAYLLLMIGVAALPELRKRWREHAQGALLFGLGAAPGLTWMLAAGALPSPPDLVALVRAYFPYHFFPSSFGANQWVAIGFLMTLFAAAWHFPPRGSLHAAGREPSAYARALWMCTGLFGFWLLGGVIMELRPNGFFLKLHAFRSSAILCTLLFPMVGGLLSRSWARRGADLPGTVFATGLVLAGLLGSAGFLSPESAATIVAAALTLLALAGVLVARGKMRQVAGALALLSALFAIAPIVAARIARNAQRARAEAPWVEVAHWARANSARDARFLIPPYLAGFRWRSERPVVGECQDGSAVLWSRTYADYWRTWYLAMGGAFDDEPISLWDRLARSWFRKDQQEIEELAQHYDADYIVLRIPRRREELRGWRIEWGEEPLFDNGVFTVYAVPASD